MAAFPACVTAVQEYLCSSVWPSCTSMAFACQSTCDNVMKHCGAEAPGSPFVTMGLTVDQITQLSQCTANMPTSNCIDSTPKIEAALQEQHQCPSPFHYRPTIYEELNDYSAAFDDGKVQRPVCIGSCCMECATVGLWPEGKTSYNKRVQIFLHLASLPFWLTCLIYELMRPNRSQRCTQSFLIVMITGHRR
ncbi:hypothetical protein CAUPRSCDRAFT_10535 [Caulochytrium protostelioides]|uniref:FZ domain-containing protein n=1 Tax=Caulochytrium protostelioides TaxID=1555241 RepID=A0A4P9WZ16_9FUNG|nr:hypothetical protein CAUPRSCDRAFT_10535 [Caulochytrium protostelioides]